MAFYKLCDCGKKSFFEHRGLAPRKCANCGRSLLEFMVIDETDVLNEEQEEAEDDDNQELEVDSFYYSLDTLDGKGSIIIPSSGGIVGRGYECLGSDILQERRSVSREHIYVVYRGRIGLLIEDRSKFGTYINEERLVKNVPKFAREGDIIKLYNYELKVVRHCEE